MPLHWKILSKKFLLNIAIFTSFFLLITIFFKLSRLTKYFLSGADGKELLLLLTIFIYRCFPFAISLTSFGAAYIAVSSLLKNREDRAFAALGLCPHWLFSPLIILSIFLSLGNLYTGFMISPYINKKLYNILEEKKENMSVLSTFSKKISKKDVYVSLQDEENGEGFLLVKTDGDFTWAICDKVTEKPDGLLFKRAYYFQVSKEDKGNTILLTQDKNAFVPKETIYSLFPATSIKIGSIYYPREQVISVFLYLLYPILFTLLGILLALKIWPILCGTAFAFVFCIFSLGTIAFFPFSTYLSLGAFLFLGPLYFATLYKYQRGRA